MRSAVTYNINVDKLILFVEAHRSYFQQALSNSLILGDVDRCVDRVLTVVLTVC